jgi:hypothetical protein
MKFCNAKAAVLTSLSMPSLLKVKAEHSSKMLITTYQTALHHKTVLFTVPDIRTSIIIEKILCELM